jgi:hypothetical protein
MLAARRICGSCQPLILFWRHPWMVKTAARELQLAWPLAQFERAEPVSEPAAKAGVAD